MDLRTKYLGLELKSPLVPSAAAPLTRDLDRVRALEDAGAAAIVMFSLFEEQITNEEAELDYFLTRSTHSYGEAITYFPDLEEYNLGPFEYLEHLAKTKEAVDIPVIGSLNGISLGGWTEYAVSMEQAGADAIEINLYFIPADPDISSQEVEANYIEVLQDVRRRVKIPIAMKLNPYFSSLFDMAKKMEAAGANGLVMFNRFYQPDIDLENLEVKPSLQLSSPYESRLPLRWAAILYGRLGLDLAITTGIHDGESAIKALMVGADVTMLCSELLRKGTGRLGEIEQEMRHWMEEHEYDSVDMMKGSMSQKSCPEPAAFERANYMKTIQSYDRYPTV
ncbi:MAG: dihydroorotate dehydrogenase-like protein [Candidatus Omnitrophica bacterium]|nr:dihydroorotate dehydrogenase-like protein [Candidatus Omnitrophota bacterium]